MEKSRSYKDLIVWQKSIQIITHIYSVTKKFPKDEIYGLISQIRRASVSIAANISEWQSRNSVGEFIQFLWIAEGSLGELETLLIISENVWYMEKEENKKLSDDLAEIKRLILALKKSIKNP